MLTIRRPMRPAAIKLAVALATVALAACQDPDVGERCPLQWGTDSSLPRPTPATAAGDYFESGNPACDDLVCIVSPASSGSKYADCEGENCGYCSKPCVSNDDCYTDDTGLVCDLVLLDPAFLAALDASNKSCTTSTDCDAGQQCGADGQCTPTVRERYLGDIAFSSFCVVPR